MNLRVTMTWAPVGDPGALDVAVLWSDRLAGAPGGPAVCIWTARAVDPPDHPAATRCCWHSLDLAPRVDRHAAHRRRDLPWSPWGTKSGPNVQFFALLDAVTALHPEEWILYAEPDTVPLGPDAARHLSATLAAHPDAWVIGAHPHPRVRPAVDDDLLYHLNGAALYRTGDPEFAAFRTGVWAPSLLDRVRHDPEYAYDCVTDPAQWPSLPPALAAGWRARSARFVATAGMVNASTLTLGPDDVAGVLADPEVVAAARSEGVRPWLLHAKGPVLDAAARRDPGYEAVIAEVLGDPGPRP